MWSIVGIFFTRLYFWHTQSLGPLILSFIIDWRVEWWHDRHNERNNGIASKFCVSELTILGYCCSSYYPENHLNKNYGSKQAQATAQNILAMARGDYCRTNYPISSAAGESCQPKAFKSDHLTRFKDSLESETLKCQDGSSYQQVRQSKLLRYTFENPYNLFWKQVIFAYCKLCIRQMR